MNLTKVTPPMAKMAHLARVNSSLSWGVVTDLERSSVERSVTIATPIQTRTVKGVKKMW